jgi:hypothetical protein
MCKMWCADGLKYEEMYVDDKLNGQRTITYRDDTKSK